MIAKRAQPVKVETNTPDEHRSTASPPTTRGHTRGPDHAPERFRPEAFTRPADKLLLYYIITAAFTLFLFPVVFLLLYLRYKSISYSFDEDGVSMKIGVLVRQETNLTYRRIQDIHVIANVIERWLGIARVAVQTASGSAGPEMVLLGVQDPEALRDYLYNRMRGARDHHRTPGTGGTPSEGSAARAIASSEPDRAGEEALLLLREIRDALAGGRLDARETENAPVVQEGLPATDAPTSTPDRTEGEVCR